MRIGRALPPAAAPIYLRDILSGLSGLHHGRQELDRFKSELKDYFGVQHCFLVSSGRAALTLILKALKLLYPHRNQVLIPAYTCYSVPSAIVRAALDIQLCDMDPETLDFDYSQLSRLLQSPSKHNKINKPDQLKQLKQPKQPNEPKQPSTPFLAIIPAHLYGIPSDIDRLRSLVGNTEAVIIEDAAQAMGGNWKNRKLGTLGDVGFFSLGRGKALSAVEGGIILTNRKDIAHQISKLITIASGYTTMELFKLLIGAVALNLFIHPTLFWLPKSFPFLKLGETIYDPDFKIRRMSPFQAGLARHWRSKIGAYKKARRENDSVWPTLIKNLKTNELSVIRYPSESDLIRFPIVVKNASLRKTILKQSEQKGLGIMPGYPDSINGIPALRDTFFEQQYPVAKQYSKQLITLPVHPYVSKDDRKRIAAAITQESK